MSQPGPNPARRPDGAALVIAAGLALFGLVLIWDSSRLPAPTGYSGIGAADVPRVIGFVLIGLGVWTGLSGLLGGGNGPADRQLPKPIAWILAGLAAQLALIGVVGFAIGTGLLFACTATAFGHRKLWISVPVGIAAALAIYGIFDRLLQLNLPTGPLETLIYGA